MVYKSIDVIVVLGAGFERVRERIKGAKSVYKLTKIKGGNPLIIFSGYDVREQDVRKLVEELEETGYRTIVEPFSKSTGENAEYLEIVLKELEEKGYYVNSVTVVTDDKHILRARGIFGSDLGGKKIGYVVVRDKRVEDFIHELFVIPLTMLGIDKILARKYR
jgi:uncharacterized SAM-binding protein YcdF (DUF218 family)